MYAFKKLPFVGLGLKKWFCGISFLIILFNQSYAGPKPGNLQKIKESQNAASIQYPEFADNYIPDLSVIRTKVNAQFNLEPTVQLVEWHRETDNIGFTHIKYFLYQKGFRIEGSMIVVHILHGKINTINGDYFPTSGTTNISIDEKSAFQSAIHEINANTYRWQIPSEEARIKRIKKDPNATWMPKAELVYCPNNYNTKDFKLAYKFDIYATEPLVGKSVYVDVNTGKVIYSLNLIDNTDARGSAKTKYSGTRVIVGDSVGSSTYYLEETGRGGGINTLNLKTGMTYSSAVDFTDADNYWNNVNASHDEVAGDAHWGAEMTYDFYYNNFGRNSFDNAGGTIYSYVHYSSKYNNAFWDGYEMNYGDGDGSLFYPLTCLDVCGHEITHGVTEYASKLAYQNESGAMNEGISDIFGTCIEFYGLGSSADWIIGKAITVSGKGIRDMSAPKNFSQPNTYNGTYYVSTSGTPSASNDYNGVHTNSGVLNYWFYLVAHGGSGTNDNSNSYSVSGIGISEAQSIAYRTAIYYLTSSATFASARISSIQAAIDLYGGCSNEVIQVTNAWYAVGVGNAYSSAAAPLKGTYTIGGSSPDFSTFKAATNALSAKGICGQVTFNVRNGTYNEQVRVGNIVGATSGSNVIFQSQNGDSSKVIITYASSSASTTNYTLELDSSSFITFKGMTIQRTGSNTYANVIYLMDNASYNNFYSNVIRGQYAASSSVTGSNSLVNSDGSSISNNFYYNNALHAGMCGFYLYGVTYYSSGNVLQNNIIDSFGLAGIYIGYQFSINIFQNTIKSSSFSSSAWASYGIRFDGVDKGFNITRNKIYIGAKASYCRGLMLYSCATTSGFVDLVYNNFLQVNNGASASTAAYLYNNTYLYFFFNNLLANYSLSSGAALYVDNSGGTTTDYVYNNNLANKGGGYANYINGGSIYSADYNNLYTSGSNLAYYTKNYTGFSTWKSGSGYDANGKNVDPSYTSTTDLHASASGIANAGLAITGINDDIDGKIRDPFKPSIGANDFGTKSCMNGTYTIGGTSPDYATFADAVKALETKGVCSNVTFKVRNGTYTEKIRIGNIRGTSSSARVTFQSDLGDSSKVILQYASSSSSTNNYVLMLDTASYVAFKQITIKTTGTNSYGTVIDLEDGASYNYFINCVILGVKGGSSGTSQSNVYTSGSADNSNGFSNVLIRYGSYGIINGGTSTASGTNFAVFQSTIDSFNNCGISLSYTTASKIYQNNITVLPNGSSTASAINLSNVSADMYIIGNIIYNKPGGYGIYYKNGASTISSNALIANNFITVASSNYSDGIYLNACGHLDVVFNNINVTSSASTSAACYINASGSYVHFYNNNFVNKGGGFSLYGYNILGNVFSNFNNLYTSGSYFSYWNGVKYASLSAHITGAVSDTNSLNIDPNYNTTTTDLHATNTGLRNKGLAYSAITTDIDGITRTTPRPCIGANEVPRPCMKGTYTIGGTSPNYASFTAAISDLTNMGVCGPVVFNVRDGSYNEVVRIGSLSGVSSTNTVTFQSQSADSSKVILYTNSATGDYEFDLDSTNWVIFKQLTIKRSSSGTPASNYNVVQLHDGASNNSFLNNCIIGINNYANTNGGRCIYSIFNNTADTSNLFRNNLIRYGYEGIHEEYTQKLIFDGNTIDSAYKRGIQVSYQVGATISRNTITNLTGTGGDAINIVEASNTIPENVYKNKIAVKNNNGISLSGISGSYSSANIYNNFITISGTATAYAINLNSATYDNIYYNNISCTNTGTAYAVYIYPASAGGVIIKNNNFINSGGGDALYVYNSSFVSACSYNNIYSSGSTLASWNGTSYSTLSNLVSGSSMNSNSKSVNPGYTSSTDLHVSNSGINNAGIPISGITDDIDGQTRSLTTPDIGADEFTPAIATDAGMSAITAPGSPICAATGSVSATLENYGTSTLTSATINWSVNGTTQTAKSWTGSLSSGSTASISLGSYAFSSGTYAIKIWSSSPNGTTDGNNANDTTTLSLTVNPLPSATVGSAATICSGTSTTIGGSSTSGHTYSWSSNPSGFSASSANPSVSPTTTTTYKLTETISATGCTKTDSVKITVNPAPTPSVGSASSICSGKSTTIGASAVAGHTYSWTSNPSGYTSTNSKPTVSPTSTTVFTLTETITATGCSAKDSVKVTVNPLPVPGVASASSICKGNSVSIGSSSTSGHSYSWSSNPSGYSSTSSNPSVSPSATTTYTLTETITATGCSNSDSVKITVNPLPSPSVASASTICNGTSVSIGGASTSGHTYSWSSNPSGYSSTGSNPSVAPSVTTVYTLTETITATGCSAKDSVKITVNLLPTPGVIASKAICTGSSISIGSASISGHTYSWTSNPSGYSSTSANPSVSPSTTTTYKLTETISATGCSNSDSTTITVNPLPLAKVANDTSVCSNTILSLGASTLSGHKYKWSSNPSGFSDTSSNPKITVLASTTYYLTELIAGTGCSKKDSVVITMKTSPKALVGSPQSLCNGSTTTIGASAVVGNTYSWTSNPSGFTSSSANPSVSPSVNTTYYLTEKVSSTSCSKTDSVKITVNALPAAAVAGGATICSGKSVSIGAAKVSGSKYKWISSPSGFSDTTSNPSVSPTTTTTYYLTETIIATGCSKTDSVLVSVNATPAAPTASNNGPLCPYSTLNLTASTVSGGSYSWTGPNSFSSSTQNPSISSVTKLDSGLYSVTVTVGSCTSAAGSTSVTINSSPKAKINGKLNVCAAASQTYSASSTGNKYSWSLNGGTLSTGAGTNTVGITWGSAGKAWIKLVETNSNSCADSTTDTVQINALPKAITGSSVAICHGDSTTIGSVSVSGNSYSWTSHPAGYTSGNSSNKVSPLVSTTYYLVETNSSTACSNSDSITITVNTRPSPAIGKIISPICGGSSVVYGTANDAGATYQWTILNGSISGSNTKDTIQVLWNAKSATGILKVIETSNFGCKDSNTANIVLNPKPTAMISVGKTCFGSATSFADTSSNYASQKWYFGDGNTSIAKLPSHTYTSAAKYAVSLVVKNSYGCTDSTSSNIIIAPIPNAHFSTKLSGKRTYLFNADDTTYSPLAYTWNFGDSSSANTYHVLHAYAVDSTYKISLSINNNGCVSSFDTSLVIFTGINSILNSESLQLNIYPNPFKEETKLSYIIPYQSKVKVSIYSLDGKCLGTLVEANQASGLHEIEIQAKDISLNQGMYLLRMMINEQVITKELIRLK